MSTIDAHGNVHGDRGRFQHKKADESGVDLDAQHAAILDADEAFFGVDEAFFGVSDANPNGRCQGCGSGLDEHGRCYQLDCTRFDPASPYAADGHTTSGQDAELVTVGQVRVGDRLLEGRVSSIDNDHKSTSIEFDGDASTTAVYGNDENMVRYLPLDGHTAWCDGYCNGSCHAVPESDLIKYGIVAPDDEHRECDDACGEHAAWCDGYCNHTDQHRNTCLDVPQAAQPFASANRADRPHPDLADEDVKEAYRS